MADVMVIILSNKVPIAKHASSTWSHAWQKRQQRYMIHIDFEDILHITNFEILY